MTAEGKRAEAAPEPLLELSGVRIRGRAGILVDGFDLALAAGEAVALVGPSGCGKSLLLRVAAGLDPPDAGERRVSDRSRAAFVFQEGGLLRNVTVEENLRLPLYYDGRTSGEAREAALEALEEFGVARFAQERPSELLGETRILVQLARAAAVRANLVFLDDPFPLLAQAAEARAARWLAAGLESSKLAVMMTAVESLSIPSPLASQARVRIRIVPLGVRATREGAEP